MTGSACGSVLAIHGGLVEAAVPASRVGAAMSIVTRDGRCIPARVIALQAGRVTLAPFAELAGLAAGDLVATQTAGLLPALGIACLGRAIDALGAPLDGGPALVRRWALGDGLSSRPASDREPVLEPFESGIPALDGPLGFGIGARIGVFGAPGCGKSTLLETIVAGSAADVTVVGLVGERGREAERWIAGIDGRTAVVCATSDRSAAERVRAGEVAFALAQTLQRRGLRVLLVLDSLARIAAAARDVALSAGEPVGRGGYPPSVFALLSGMLERAGNFRNGSITLVATVLSDGPDDHDPVSHACRAALDGHIVLSQRLARQGWFPAIDVPASASRTLTAVGTPAHVAAARRLRHAVAILDETREARSFGLDPGAGNPAVRNAMEYEAAIAAFLRRGGPVDLPTTLTQLLALTDRLYDGHSG